MNLKTIATIGSEATALLTALAMIPYSLGDASLVIPPAWKQTALVVFGVSTLILRIVKAWADAHTRAETETKIQTLQANAPEVPKS